MDAEWTIKVALNKIISHTETLDNITKSKEKIKRELSRCSVSLTGSTWLGEDKRNHPKDQINFLSHWKKCHKVFGRFSMSCCHKLKGLFTEDVSVIFIDFCLYSHGIVFFIVNFHALSMILGLKSPQCCDVIYECSRGSKTVWSRQYSLKFHEEQLQIHGK